MNRTATTNQQNINQKLLRTSKELVINNSFHSVFQNILKLAEGIVCNKKKLVFILYIKIKFITLDRRR